MSHLAAFQHRVTGGINRVAWSAHDVARLAERFGVQASGVALDYAPPAIRQAPEIGPTTKEAASDSFTFTISTASVDRMSDTIKVDGWKLAEFRRNPVVLWGHQADALPIGSATSVWIENGKRLKATMVFAPGYQATRVREMVVAGTLKATSVGFRPLKFVFSDDPSRRFGIDFQEQELLEFSIVAIPANAEALLDAGQTSTAAGKAAARRSRELEVIKIRASF